MPSSAVRTFTDPDDYAAAIRQGTYNLTVTERGDFGAKLIRIDLHRLWMQRFYDNLARISHLAGWGQRSVIAFRTQSGPSLLSGGVEMQPTNIVRYSEGQDYYRRSSGQAAYGGMSLPIDEMAATGEAMAGVDLTPPRDAMLAAPGDGNGDTSATTRRGWRSGGKSAGSSCQSGCRAGAGAGADRLPRSSKVG
jgi:hypothetical protein